MNVLLVVVLSAILLVALGCLLGAELQDRLLEGQRRRLAARRHELNIAWRTLHTFQEANGLRRSSARYSTLPVFVIDEEVE